LPVVPALLVAAALFAPLPGIAAALPARPAGPVADYANILAPATRAELDGLCRGLERAGQGVLVVATVSSLEGKSEEQYGVELATAWEIGHKGKDDGVLLLIAPNERKVRIEVGYGLEAKLPDGKCGGIIRGYITPKFKRGDFDGGILSGARAIADILGGRAPAKAAEDAPPWNKAQFEMMLQLVFFLGIPAVMLLIRWIKRNDPRWRNRPGSGSSLLWFGGLSGGGGRGGGFGGFGGGGFGGGGSSGSW
jgi:uncharacterized protein